MSELLDAFLAYAKIPLFVFPVRGKHPLVADWPNVATTDEVRIRAWLDWHPDTTGIGVACGPSGLLVVDLDGPEAADKWDDLAGRHAPVSTAVVSTGRPGGRHLWFRHDHKVRPLKNSASKVALGIDTRGNGGFVIAPPSRHPSGRRYEWVDRSTPVRAPSWLISLLDPPRRPPTRPGTGRRLSVLPGGRYARAALSGEVDKVLAAPEGCRNDTLNRAAYSLGQLVGPGVLEADLAARALLIAALKAGLSETEARRTILSGLNAGAGAPRRGVVA